MYISMFILEHFPPHRFAVVTGVYFSKTTVPSSPFPLYVEFTTMFYFETSEDLRT